MRSELLRTASATLATRGCCSIPQVVGQIDPLPVLTWRLARIAPENRADLWFSLGQAVSADPGRAMVPVFHRRGSDGRRARVDLVDGDGRSGTSGVYHGGRCPDPRVRDRPPR